MKEHKLVTLDRFNGLYDRGEPEECPLDHFSDCNNLQFIGEKSFDSRDGIDGYWGNIAVAPPLPLGNIKRIYNFPTTVGNTLLVLSDNTIYHVNGTTTFAVMTLVMSDFAFVPFNGRAYISPFTTTVIGTGTNQQNIEKGVASEFLYVYKGDFTTVARKAAGAAPTGTLTIANGAACPLGGVCVDPGFHIYGVVFETDTGYLSAPGALIGGFVPNHGFTVSFSTVPVGGVGSGVVKRHIVASKAILNYTGDLQGYQLFFIPGATINDNTTTTLSNIDFFDADLLEDASHLFDNFAEIPAGVHLSTYHNRLVMLGENSNTSIARVSFPGEPEAISQVDGLLQPPNDGVPLTNAGELRDILFVFKRNKTYSFIDNGDIPSLWPMVIIDSAMGCGVHGLGTVADAGSANIDYLLVASYKGIALFNGRYILPELTFKIQARWVAQDFQSSNRRIQVLNDPVNERVYCITTDRNMLMGDYKNGFDARNIRWSPWDFDGKVSAITMENISTLVIGCVQV